MFTHLHNHTHYSILEGLPKPGDYIKKAVEFGMTSLAITDTMNVYGCHEFYKTAKKSGIKPILGAEVFINSSLDKNINHKLVLLAKSEFGYRNLIEILTHINLEGADKKVSLEDIKGCTNDLIALSGPISGEIPFYILSGKSDDEIMELIKRYQNVFSPENFYLELLDHRDIPKQDLVTGRLIELHNKYNLNLVACNNNYYVNKSDKQTQDVIQALGTGHEVDNHDRPTLINGDYSFLNEEEMQALFGYIPVALENTQKIASQVNINIETGRILIPVFNLPEEVNLVYQKHFESYININTGNNNFKDSETILVSSTRTKGSPEGQSLVVGGQSVKHEDDNIVTISEGQSSEISSSIKGQLSNNQKLKELSSDEWYLRYLCFKGMNSRFNSGFSDEMIDEFIKKVDVELLDKPLVDYQVEELKSSSKAYFTEKKKEIILGLDQKTQERIDRLEYELFVVHKMGFDAYFLIVSDYIDWGKNNGVPVGPGRGSAAGALLAYLTNITDLDPMEFDLLFERFLNPARVSMPDIDTDFADNGRDKVIDYCRNKYGADRVVQICTFGTFAARAAVKDVGRVRGVSFAEMNDLAKLIPEKPGTKLTKALEESVEFKTAYDENQKYKEIIDDALKIEGNVRQIGVHACAVIIAPEKMTNFTALQHPPKDINTVVTQYSAYPLEDLGLLKMDFLGLRNLSIIKRTGHILKRNKNIDLDVLGIDLNNQEVLDVFALGDTTGVFQFESDGMRMWLRNLKPTSFNDIIAMVALYRPGPMKFIETYINRKYGKEQIDYMYPELEEELKKKYGKDIVDEERKKLFEDLSSFMDVTYGIAVYQEQLMRIVQSMAGFSLAEADLLRRGVGKKKKEVVEKLKIEFIDKSATFRGYKEETSRTIYEQMIMPAADYSFNKSHAACYAFIAYQTAYLKAYHRTEFITAMMVSDEEDLDRISLEVGEALSNKINILPPSINESLKHFTYIDDNNIRFGLKAIKGLGDGPIDKIIEVRNSMEGGKFTNLDEFVKHAGKEVINKKSLEALIKSGSMDDLGDRGQMFHNIEEILRFSKGSDNKKITSQMGLFDLGASGYQENLVLIKSEPFRYEEKLFFEKEVLGFMVSGHPLDNLKRYCEKRSSNTKFLKMSINEIKFLYEREETDEKKKKFLSDIREKQVKTIGVIVGFRKILTKTGKNMMFISCEGYDVDFEITVFDRDFASLKDSIEIGKIIYVEGNLNLDLEYGRKSISSRKASTYSLTKVREQARDAGYFTEDKRGIKITELNKLNEIDEDSNENKTDENINKNKIIADCECNNVDNMEINGNIYNNDDEGEEKVQEKITRYVVEIPSIAKKTDLISLKQFLEEEEKGDIKIYLNLRGQEIDTKISILDINNLIKWLKVKWI
ncbi:MAG: DNA polymerase III subunit alpha [Candidatus Gracilibacteria bacterium]|nr:DNA polymerase III subunit alpha [Candidatus Gracilibacteria bacterium]